MAIPWGRSFPIPEKNQVPSYLPELKIPPYFFCLPPRQKSGFFLPHRARAPGESELIGRDFDLNHFNLRQSLVSH